MKFGSRGVVTGLLHAKLMKLASKSLEVDDIGSDRMGWLDANGGPFSEKLAYE